MALPIAQLGYMPNITAPSRGGDKYMVEDPWQKIATMALSTMAQQAAGNLMQQDYSNQAQTEGLVPNGGPAGDTPDNAPWYKRMLQGPQMNERQYTAAQGRMADRDQTRSQQKYQSGESEKNRAQQQALHDSRTLQENSQFDRKIALEQGEQELRRTSADRGALLQGAGLENDRRRTDIMANPPAPQADPDTMKRVVGNMAEGVYKTRMEEWSKAAGMAMANQQPPPPQPTYRDAVAEAAQAAAEFMGMEQQPAPTAPSIPLVDPAMFKFGQ